MEKLIAGAAGLGFPLSPRQMDRFERYYAELIVWNERINLTSVTDREQVQTRHFLDSLTVGLALPEAARHGRVVDVGSGAGFPGIPLKVLFPEMSLTLVEATAKKVKFLRHVAGLLELSDVEVECRRAEELAQEPGHREAYDAVVARAVAPMPALLELTLPFCRIGGIAVAQKKGAIDQEIEGAREAAGLLGGRLRDTVPVSVPELDDGRVLVVAEKVKQTPDRYPRRAGVPQKRPLARPAGKAA